jgi:molybdopterin/thiamine biosynthesis adenylyltransferase
MANRLQHETLYRGRDLLARLAATRIVVCGAGAIGSHLADNLARQGAGRLRVIDRDRVEESNLGTQIYGEGEVGQPKAEALRNRLFRALGVEIEAVAKPLTDRNAAKLLDGAGLVIDAFDNADSRRLVQQAARAGGLACLHAGLNGGYGEAIWDERYRVPDDVGDDACDYPLARNLVGLAVAVASETVLRWLADGTRADWSITLGDLAIRGLEARVEVGG